MSSLLDLLDLNQITIFNSTIAVVAFLVSTFGLKYVFSLPSTPPATKIIAKTTNANKKQQSPQQKQRNNKKTKDNNSKQQQQQQQQNNHQQVKQQKQPANANNKQNDEDKIVKKQQKQQTVEKVAKKGKKSNKKSIGTNNNAVEALGNAYVAATVSMDVIGGEWQTVRPKKQQQQYDRKNVKNTINKPSTVVVDSLSEQLVPAVVDDSKNNNKKRPKISQALLLGGGGGGSTRPAAFHLEPTVHQELDPETWLPRNPTTTKKPSTEFQE